MTMFCANCGMSIPTAGHCLRCYPQWHAYHNGFPQSQMARGPFPHPIQYQPMQQSQFLVPRAPVQYQPIPQPLLTDFGFPAGYPNQYCSTLFGPNHLPYTPNFERQYHPVNPIAGPCADTFEIARVPNRTVAFETDDEAEDILTDPDEFLMPRALQEEWLSISERQHRIQCNSLEEKQRLLEEYVDRMDDSGYRNLDHRQLVRNTIGMIEPWLQALDDLRDQDPSPGAASRIRYVNRKHAFVSSSAPGQPQFETGIIDQDFRLGDIRRKRFINSGVQCSKCAGGEADHPERTHNEMYEIFSYFVGPKLVDKKKWCQICTKQRFTKKGRLHHTDQHDLGMWYDHPDNDFDKLGQFEEWKHVFPSKELKWKPKPVAQMYKDMRRAQLPASAYA